MTPGLSCSGGWRRLWRRRPARRSLGAIPLPTLRLTLATGLLGGFTTYSSFNYETLQFLRSDSWLLASVNVGATVLGCLAAGILGIWAGRILAGS
jgi:fluoride ion exporter CrcB/FEX